MGTNGVPFGYLEFSRAIWGKLCPHARRRSSSGSYLVRFFLNRVSRVWCTSLQVLY